MPDHEGARGRPSGPAATVAGGGARRAAVAAAACAYGWWAVGLPPFSWEASLAVLAAGAAAAVAGGRRRQRRPAGRPVDVGRVVPWLALLAAAATLELSSYLQQPRADHPTISSLTNALLDSHPARAAAFAGWLAATVALARR
jgi:hypothetical protein